jgi:hypothetical protein
MALRNFGCVIWDIDLNSELISGGFQFNSEPFPARFTKLQKKAAQDVGPEPNDSTRYLWSRGTATPRKFASEYS